MKQFFSLCVTALLILGLAACAAEEVNSDVSAVSEPTPQATTTTKSTAEASTTTTVSRRPSTTTSTTATTSTTTPKSDYHPTPAAAQTLANSQYLLTQKKAFNIAYYGGSITQGTGASNEETTSWRALTTAWLKSTYPDAVITEIEAANGGTGTYFGKMRTDFELLNYNPDLIFIEFLVNDQLERKTVEQSKENLEIIIRKCYQHNPNVDIVLVYTSTVGLPSGNPHTQAFNQIANHYGLSVIDVGAALEKADGELTDYFTKDQVHPNDKGYQTMANEVIVQLTAMLAKAGTPQKLTAHQTPQPLKEDLSLGVSAYKADEILAQNPSLNKLAPNTYCSVDSALVTKGQAVTFNFKGTSVGVWWRCFDRSTIISCELDGEKNVTKVLKNNTHYTYELFENLKNTDHALTITYNGDTALYLPYIFVTN